MKRVLYTLFVIGLILVNSKGFSQAGVLDPTDPDVIFTAQNQPPAPPYNQISKWGHTVRLNWNPYSYGYKSYIFRGMAFRVKFPKTYQPGVNDGKKYPCFLFLHGLGEWAEIHDNELQLVHGAQTHAQHDDEFDGFLLYPQSSSGWLVGYENTILALLDSMTKYVKLDQDRVILSGLSSGGQAAWDLLNNHPERYASASIISAGHGSDMGWVKSVLSIPAWVANGGKDKAPDPSSITIIVNKYNELGGDIQQSFYPNAGHGVWNNLWAEPGYFDFIKDAHKAQPVVKFHHNEFCPNEAVRAVLILQPGFYQYEWEKNGDIMANEDGDSLVATDYGVYRARFKRTATSEWSDWSPRPITISQKEATVTPPITIDGLHSNVLPAPDGSTTVPLKVPEGYASYDWRRVSDNALVSSGNTFIAPVGQYKVQVTETFGCSSSYSDPYTVIAANGTDVPDKATSVNAITLSNTSIEVYWNNNPSPQFNETLFEIYRSNQPGGNYVLAGKVPADTLQFVDAGLQSNVKYYYIVRAVNNNGSAPLSNEVNASTYADNNPPTSPFGLAVLGTTRHSVLLSWGESNDDAGIKYYEVYVNGEKAYTTQETSFNVNSLDSFQNYSFYVKAIDLAGNGSVPSNQVVAYTKSKGLDYKVYQGSWTVLPNFSALTPVFTGHSKNVDISASPFTENFGMVWQGWIYIPKSATYTFYLNSDDGSALYLDKWYGSGVTASLSHDGVHGNTEKKANFYLTKGMHKIGLTYFQGTGGLGMTLSWSSISAGILTKVAIPDSYLQDQNVPSGTVPNMPSNLVATVQAYNKVNLTWNDNSSNETGFELYRKGPGDPDFVIIGLAGAGATSFTDSLVKGSTTYSYAIQAINTNGSSGFNPEDLSGVSYNYYEGVWDNLPNFNALTPVTSGTINNFSLAPRISQDGFAFKYSATINIPTSGTYTFYTKSDDGSKLYIDNFTTAGQVVNNDYLQGPTERSGNKTLSAGPHKIYVTFFEKGGGEFLEVRWAGPGITKQLIPDAVMKNSRTEITTPAPPATPDAPGDLQITVVSATTLGISFSDNSTQTGYEIYRSLDGQATWRIIKNLQTSDVNITLLDSGMYPNTMAYYKVRAYNASGFSAYSEIKSAKTMNTNPIITQMGNRSVYFAGTTLVPVTAVDYDGDNLKFTVSGLPAFAQFDSTSNGKGNLVFTTQPSDAGVYNLKIIVNDGNGGKDSTDVVLTVTSNRQPILGRVQSVTMNEGSIVVRPISAIDPDRFTNVKYQIKDAPSFVEGRTVPEGFSVFLSPGYADAGNYEFWIIARDGSGGFDSAKMNVTVLNFTPPSPKVYINILNNGSTPVPSAPWNNLTSSSSNNLLDNTGAPTTTSISISPAVWNTSALGGGTGNNSGVYTDDVIRDNFYFGNFGIPDTIRLSLSGLAPNSRYNVNLFAASSYSTGSTVFDINGQVKSINAYNNVRNTADYKQLVSDASGIINVKMYKSPGTSIGYLNAIVIEKPFDDGTKPVAPTNFVAAPLPNGSVLLQWVDVAYNESGYRIFRSNTLDGTYTMVNTGTGNANDSNYVDNSVFGNQEYFYKIVAYNDYGTSDTAGIANVTAINKAPVLNDIANVFTQVQSSSVVQIVGVDNPGEQLQIETSGLPAFATLSVTGNGTAEITVSPSEGDEGFYNNISVKVTDQYGKSDVRKFSISVAEAGIRSVYLNFSNEGLPAESAPWNNYLHWPGGGYTIANLTDVSNANTGFSFQFVNTLSGNAATGMPAGNKGIFSDNVLTNAVQISTNNTYTMRFSGLNPANKYNVAFMSSLNYGMEDSATFTSQGKTVGVRGNYNTKKLSQLNGLIPNASGIIEINFSKSAASRSFLLNALILQEYSGDPVVKPGDLFTEPTVNANTVKLIWSDRSDSETGYEVWRSDAFNGTYNLVATVAANETSYIDASGGLIPGKSYFYKIRTKRNTSYSSYSKIAQFSVAFNQVLLNFNAESANNEAQPWNNTNDGPSAEGTSVLDMINSNFVNTGIDFEITKTFNGKGFAGMASGVLPYNVIYTNYWTDAGQVSEIKFSQLDQRKQYRIGIMNSVDLQSNYHNGIYSVNGQSLQIDGTANTSKIIYFENLSPDENGEIYLSVTPTAISSYCFTNALILESFDPVTSESNTFSFEKNSISVPVNSGIQTVGTLAPVHDFRKEIKLSAFPNPFVDQLVVDMELPAGSKAMKLELYDIQSRLILTREIEPQLYGGTKTINLPVDKNLAPGNYLLKLVSDKNQKVIKLVKGK